MDDELRRMAILFADETLRRKGPTNTKELYISIMEGVIYSMDDPDLQIPTQNEFKDVLTVSSEFAQDDSGRWHLTGN